MSPSSLYLYPDLRERYKLERFDSSRAFKLARNHDIVQRTKAVISKVKIVNVLVKNHLIVMWPEFSGNII